MHEFCKAACVCRHSMRKTRRMEQKEKQCQLYDARLIAFTSHIYMCLSCVNHLAALNLFLSSFSLLEIHYIECTVHTHEHTIPDERRCLLFIQSHMLMHCDLCVNIIHRLLLTPQSYKSVAHCSC